MYCRWTCQWQRHHSWNCAKVGLGLQAPCQNACTLAAPHYGSCRLTPGPCVARNARLTARRLASHLQMPAAWRTSSHGTVRAASVPWPAIDGSVAASKAARRSISLSNSRALKEKAREGPSMCTTAPPQRHTNKPAYTPQRPRTSPASRVSARYEKRCPRQSRLQRTLTPVISAANECAPRRPKGPTTPR